ncbi:hypothetical protein TNCV_4225411 [Trichonephila clavipes]|uniref:Uncharacterized protein n=1 Tax=Trichonephila clavipes TaxID=2585209 RepID=A0A8X6VHT4_TRICX|nr:hypothetical protein TNCV_4225411 [Trichonephila clavipes]
MNSENIPIFPDIQLILQKEEAPLPKNMKSVIFKDMKCDRLKWRIISKLEADVAPIVTRDTGSDVPDVELTIKAITEQRHLDRIIS